MYHILPLSIPGLKQKTAVRLFGTGRFSCQEVTFHSHLPIGESMQVVCQRSHNKNKLRLAQGQATFESSFSELQAGIKFFLDLNDIQPFQQIVSHINSFFQILHFVF